jgi:hypothetical protein
MLRAASPFVCSSCSEFVLRLIVAGQEHQCGAGCVRERASSSSIKSFIAKVCSFGLAATGIFDERPDRLRLARTDPVIDFAMQGRHPSGAAPLRSEERDSEGSPSGSGNKQVRMFPDSGLPG